MRHLSLHSRAAILLMLLVAIAPRTQAACTDFLADVNTIRAQGCVGQPGVKPALRRVPELDRAAEALASGHRFAKALEDAGYVAVQSAMLEATGSDAEIVSQLGRSGCANIADPVYR